MRFQLNFQRLLMFSFLVPVLAACLAVMPSMPSDDKCPDGSKKDHELGCRQSTRATDANNNKEAKQDTSKKTKKAKKTSGKNSKANAADSNPK